MTVLSDDDESVRESLPDSLRGLGYEAEAFSSAEEFLGALSSISCGCTKLSREAPQSLQRDFLARI